MLTQDFLKEYFSYNPETGLFTRLKIKSCFRGCKVGDIAGSKYSDGYIYLKINGGRHKAHRLVFLYLYGQMPLNEVDHINSVKDDNRLSNLREVTKAENLQNQIRPQKHNKCGLLGVCFDKESNKFMAKIRLHGKQKNLGRFNTKEEAHQAYLVAKREFHSTCTI